MSTAGTPGQAVKTLPVLLGMAVTGWVGLQVVNQLGVGDPSRIVALFGALLLALWLISREAPHA